MRPRLVFFRHCFVSCVWHGRTSFWQDQGRSDAPPIDSAKMSTLCAAKGHVCFTPKRRHPVVNRHRAKATICCRPRLIPTGKAKRGGDATLLINASVLGLGRQQTERGCAALTRPACSADARVCTPLPLRAGIFTGSITPAHLIAASGARA